MALRFWKRLMGAALASAAGLFLFMSGAAAQERGSLADMTLGADDAPVRLIEYASLTCNHCAAFHAEAFPRLKSDYIETGKVHFTLRELPVVPAHPALVARSYAGTMLARCIADEDGAEGYFSAMKTLFEAQKIWAFGEDARGELLKIANDAGLDEAGFDACIAREDLITHIDKNVAIATDEFAVRATPGFIINGDYRRYDSFEALFDALDAAVEKASGGAG
ncbi:MAG: thioredoxin domain-containing protein [Pseudomonadota bacterium]